MRLARTVPSFATLKRAIASRMAGITLLRGDFRASERALAELKKSKRKTVVALKETGAHQSCTTAERSGAIRLALSESCAKPNGGVASTPEAADFPFRFISR